MTAQVAVMNTQGIALASDSAVTISGKKTEKIYSTSDKLFRLSESAPVAVMTSGVGNLLGMPWETMFKMYRNQLGNKSFARLSDYATDFFLFVRTNVKMFPQETQERCTRLLMLSVVEDVFNVSLERGGEIPEAGDKAIKAEFNLPIIREVVSEKLKKEKGSEKVIGLTHAAVRVLRTEHEPLAAGAREAFFGKSLPEKISREIDALTIESIVRTSFESPPTTIVVSGFGDDEYMPSCLVYGVDGVVHNAPRYRLDREKVISQETVTASIMPFAQSKVVYTFFHGISPSFEKRLNGAIDDFFASTEKFFRKMFGQECTVHQDGQLTSMIQKKKEELSKKLGKSKRKHWNPIVNMVEYMPKNELAAMAETLVNLTKFRRRVSPGQETVGGPIDVALITKGDGFVWIKKKQYYPAELNPHKARQPF